MAALPIQKCCSRRWGLRRVRAGGYMGRLGSASQPPSPADPWLMVCLPVLLTHPWPHVPPPPSSHFLPQILRK